MPESFSARAAAARARRGPLVFGLDPSPALLSSWGLSDDSDGLEAFVDLALLAAASSVGFVKPQSAFYERHGWRGMRALERLVAEARSAGLLVILDAKRGDIGSTNAAYATTYFGAAAPLDCDALTISPYLGLGAMAPFFEAATAAQSGLFVVVHSSNPEGRALQGARLAGDGTSVAGGLIGELAAMNARLAPGGVGPMGAVVAIDPPAELALDTFGGLLLVPGVGAQGATPEQVAASFAGCVERVLPSASRSLLAAGPEPAKLAEVAASLSARFSELLGC